jgi:hypothetical protein
MTITITIAAIALARSVRVPKDMAVILHSEKILSALSR